MQTVRVARCLRVAMLVACATSLTTGAAHAAPASVEPGSFVSLSLGRGTYPVDLRFVGGSPCALLGGFTVPGGQTARLTCGTRLTRGHLLNTSGANEFPTHLDATDQHVDAVGYTQVGTSRTATRRPWLARVGHDGAPVMSFGGSGSADLQAALPAATTSARLLSVDSLPDGSAVVVGNASANPTGDLVPFVARVTASGQLDPTFGVGGTRDFRIPGWRRINTNDVRVLDDGRVLVVGWASNTVEGTFVGYAALFTAAGVLDPSFGGDGIITPRLSAGATSLGSIATSPNAGSFPIFISGSSNVRSSVRSFVVQVGADGTLVSPWGGAASHKVETLSGHPRIAQYMDIERLPDGRIVGALEREVNGDYDSVLARFKALSGTPDTSFGLDGFEPIDTRPGMLDGEYSSAIALSPDGTPWVLGASSAGGGNRVHLYRTRNRGSRTTAAIVHAEVVAVGAKGVVQACGSTARRACVVRAGKPLVVGTAMLGWDASRSPLLRPSLHVWSKPRGTSRWSVREQVGGVYRSGRHTVMLTTVRLGRGTHEVYGHRNGGPSWGVSWSSALHVRVP